MKRKIFILQLIGTIVLLALLIAGCSQNDTDFGVALPENLETATDGIGLDTSGMFSDRDMEIGYADYATVTLTDGGCDCDSDAVDIDGSTVTITDEGTYLISGTLSNGQIIVNAGDDDKVQLVFDGVSLINDQSAALYIKQADKVFLTLTGGKNNSLAVSGEYVQSDENNVDAVIFSKDDLTINGLGALTITSEFGHGIVSKDDLAIIGGTFEIDVAGHGLSGKDSVRIADGNLTIIAGKDGIHAENEDDDALGFIYIANGDFSITSGFDGIDADYILQIDNGNFEINSGGGSVNASTEKNGNIRPDWGDWSADTQNTTDTDSDTGDSAKGLKASVDLIINNGVFNIDSSDDALHANADIYLFSGDLAISSGDDGMHADTSVKIYDGAILINKSYEGIEGQSIEIAGGVISIIASDDGLNAAGGNDGSALGGRPGQSAFTADTSCNIIISGGRLDINASGDGVDSNGSLTISGGETYVSGPTNSGNGALDYAGNGEISGGIFVAAGSSGMAQNFDNESSQGAILYNLASVQEAGAEIILTDSSDEVIVSYTPQKQYQSILISAPQISDGQTYTLNVGDSSQTIEMSGTIYSYGDQSDAFGGGMQGGNMQGNIKPGGGQRPQ